jgi:hypothetical protein
MSDVTKCKGFKCPLKENCYRFKAVPNEYRQSYYMNPPYNKVKKDCQYIIPIITGVNSKN